MTDSGIPTPEEDCRGQAFSAEGYLIGFTVGYLTYDLLQRASECRIFDSPITDMSQWDSCMAKSTGTRDEQAFGSGGYSRTYIFDGSMLLVSGQMYYAYFDQPQSLCQIPGSGFIDVYWEMEDDIAAQAGAELR